MAFKRATLFHFFGFEVRADASWFFLAVLIAWTVGEKVYPLRLPGLDTDMYAFMGALTAAGIFISIIAHEVAHAVIAEYYQMPIRSITLFIFGGVAEMKGEPSHPKGEFLMAIAGPIMSLLMGLFFNAASDLITVQGGSAILACVLHYLGEINIMIALFNILPFFPLDGGRALRAVLWQRKNNFVVATRMASGGGAFLAYVLFGYACWRLVIHDDMVAGLWWGLIGFFVHATSTESVRQAETNSLLAGETVARFMRTDAVAVSPDLSVAELVDGYIGRHYQRLFPVVDHGQLVGMVSLRDVLTLDRAKWQWLHVSRIMTPPAAVDPALPAADAFDLMRRRGGDTLIVAEGGRYLGILAWRDFASYLSITTAVDRDTPVRKGRPASGPLPCLLPALLAAGMLAGCSAATVAAPEKIFTYDCGGTPVTFDSTQTMRAEGKAWEMKLAISGSGARYAASGDPKTVFWSKGDEAYVTIKGRVLPDCAMTARTATQ